MTDDTVMPSQVYDLEVDFPTDTDRNSAGITAAVLAEVVRMIVKGGGSLESDAVSLTSLQAIADQARAIYEEGK